jgi:hypothetical protein
MADAKGYLNVCMDKRFWKKATDLFARETGLGMTDFWVETNPGGANTKADVVGEDFAASSGATIMGWGAHGSHCGGQPGVSDDESKARLLKKIEEKKLKFPQAKHCGLFFTDTRFDIWEI